MPHLMGHGMTVLHGTWAAVRAHMAAGERCCNQCARVLDREQYGSAA